MVRQRLLELQWRQLNHDELYHREIARLTVGDRMKHMALHLAKYAGQIAEADEREDQSARQQHLVDCFIISLAAANTVSLDVGRGLDEQLAGSGTLQDLGIGLVRRGTRERSNADTFLRGLTIAVGKLAKACESLDHVEAFAFRERMQQAVTEVFLAVIAEAARCGIDLEQASVTRQDAVRGRHLFDAFLRPTFDAATSQTSRS